MSCKQTALLIRSADRTSASDPTHQFAISFREPLDGKYRLAYCMIPDSVYNVRTGVNDMIYFNDNATNKSATLSAGYYTGSSLAAAVASVMTTASAFQVYTCAYSTTTGKIATSAGANFYFRWSVTAASAAVVMGYNATDTPAATSSASTNVLGLSGLLSLFIDIKEASLGGNIQSVDGLQSHLYIPLNTGFGAYVSLEEQNLPQDIVFSQATRLLSISIRDSSNALVDLNGANWECLLRRQGAYPEIAH